MSTKKKQASMSIGNWIGWGILMVLAVAVAVGVAGRYITFDEGVSAIPLNVAIPPHFLLIALHAITGGLALLIGPIQFLPRVRARYPAAHRIAGRVYMICVAFSSIVSFGAGLVSTSGMVAQFGFCFLAIIWFYSIVQAYRAIRQRQIQLHRIWMIRNYALTSAAILLRIWLGGGIAYLVMTGNTAMLDDVTQTPIYTTAAWISWVFPLIIAEWFINQRFIKAQATRQDQVVRKEQPAPVQ